MLIGRKLKVFGKTQNPQYGEIIRDKKKPTYTILKTPEHFIINKKETLKENKNSNTDKGGYR